MNEQFDSPLFGTPVAGTEDSDGQAPRRSAMIRTSPLANHAGDLKSLARRRLPRIVYDFLEGGSHDEITMRRNRADFDALFLRQRVFDHFAVRTS